MSVVFQKEQEDDIVVPVAGNTWQATARSNPDAAARLEQVRTIDGWEMQRGNAE